MALKSEEKEDLRDILEHPGLKAIEKILKSIVDKKAKALLNHSLIGEARPKLYDVKCEYQGAKSLVADFEGYLEKLKRG